jgi:hypothetical protein
VDGRPLKGIIKTRENIETFRVPGPPSRLYSGYRFCFPGVKRPGREVDHPPQSSAEVKETVELYFYSPFGPLWQVIG